MLFLGLAAGCPKTVTPVNLIDMTPGKTCSELCQRYAVCYSAAHPEFVGLNTLVPCENTCYAVSEQIRIDLRACHAKECQDYLACGMTAGLTLMAKPMVDASVPPDLRGTADLTGLADDGGVADATTAPADASVMID